MKMPCLHEHLRSTATTRKLVLEWHGGVAVPSKPKKPCVFPGCPALVTGRYCEEHARKVNSDYEKDHLPSIKKAPANLMTDALITTLFKIRPKTFYISVCYMSFEHSLNMFSHFNCIFSFIIKIITSSQFRVLP